MYVCYDGVCTVSHWCGGKVSCCLLAGDGVSAHVALDVDAHIGVAAGRSVVVSGVAPSSHWAAGRTAAPSTDGSAGSQLLGVTAGGHVVVTTELLGQGTVHLLPSVRSSGRVSDGGEELVNVSALRLPVSVVVLVRVASRAKSAGLTTGDNLGGHHRVVVGRLDGVNGDSSSRDQGLGVLAHLGVSISVNTAGQVVGVESDVQSVQALNSLAQLGSLHDANAVIPQGSILDLHNDVVSILQLALLGLGGVTNGLALLVFHAPAGARGEGHSVQVSSDLVLRLLVGGSSTDQDHAPRFITVVGNVIRESWELVLDLILLAHLTAVGLDDDIANYR